MFTCAKCGTDWCQQPSYPSELWGGFKCPWCGYVNEDETFEEILMEAIMKVKKEMDDEVS
jgi:hypothetical protein